MNFHLLSLFSAFFCMACTTAQRASDLQTIDPDERIVLGDVKIKDNEETGKTEILSPPYLFFATQDQLVDAEENLSSVDCDMKTTGCTFNVAFSKDEFVVHSLNTREQDFVADELVTFPIYSKVPKSTGPCEYIGTYRVEVDKGVVRYKIVDEFEEFKKNHQKTLSGCKLSKNLAQILPEQEVQKVDPDKINRSIQ